MRRALKGFGFEINAGSPMGRMLADRERRMAGEAADEAGGQQGGSTPRPGMGDARLAEEAMGEKSAQNSMARKGRKPRGGGKRKAKKNKTQKRKVKKTKRSRRSSRTRRR